MWQRLTVVALLGWFASVAIAQESEAPARSTLQVGVVDGQAAFDRLDEKQAIEADHRAALTTMQEGLAQRRREIKALEDSLRLMTKGEASYEQAREQMLQKAAELEAWGKLKQQLLNRELKARLEAVQQKMLAAASELAKEQGFDVVLNKRAQLTLPAGQAEGGEVVANVGVPIVFFVSDAADLTDRVVERMNSEFKPDTE